MSNLAAEYSERIDQTRNRLMDACVEVAADKGINGLRVKEVVERSGISRQTVYNHYANKKELLNDTFLREGVRLSEASNAELAKADSLEDKFLRGLLFVYDYLPKHPLLKEIVFNNREFFSYVDFENYSPSDFGYLCLRDVFVEYPQLEGDLAELTEYWARCVFSLLTLPSERDESPEALEAYARKRLVPGLCLDQYELS